MAARQSKQGIRSRGTSTRSSYGEVRLCACTHLVTTHIPMYRMYVTFLETTKTIFIRGGPMNDVDGEEAANRQFSLADRTN